MTPRLHLRGVLYLATIYVFLFLPALIVVVFSFNNSRFWSFPLRGFTLSWYATLFARPDALQALWNSATVAAPTVVVSLALGAGVAVVFHRRRFPMKALAEGVMVLPLLIPNLIWSIALLLLLSYCKIPFGAGTVILGHVLATTPFVILLVGARLQSLDPNLEDAARSLGAGTWMVACRVVMPHLAPALVASALISFAISFSDLVVAFFLGGGGFNTLPVFIYSLIQFEPSPVVNAISSLIFAVGVLCVLFAMRIGGRDVILVGRRPPDGS